jgi:hypothetical protein
MVILLFVRMKESFSNAADRLLLRSSLGGDVVGGALLTA